MLINKLVNMRLNLTINNIIFLYVPININMLI